MRILGVNRRTEKNQLGPTAGGWLICLLCPGKGLERAQDSGQKPEGEKAVPGGSSGEDEGGN